MLSTPPPRTVRVLSVGVVSQFDEREMRDFSIQESWEHNMLVAQYARAILSCERATKTQLDEGFLAGMMHDAGKLVLVSNCPDRFEAAGLFAERDRAEREDVERRLFGGSHAAVGGYLLARWSLPVSVVEAVLYHHVPGQCREVEFGVRRHRRFEVLAQEIGRRIGAGEGRTL